MSEPSPDLKPDANSDSNLAGAFLQQHWWVLLLGAVLLLTYWDLKTDLMELRHQPTYGSRAPSVSLPVVSSPMDDAGSPLATAIRTTPEIPPAWRCTGRISRQRLRASMGRFAPSIFTCHGQVSRPRGTFFIALRVAQDGTVSAGHFSGTLARNQPLASCVRGHMRTWRLPAPEGGECAIVTLPFVLGPQSGQRAGNPPPPPAAPARPSPAPAR